MSGWNDGAREEARDLFVNGPASAPEEYDALVDQGDVTHPIACDCEECEQMNAADKLRESVNAWAPKRIVVGANGAYWRDFGTHYSICPVSDDNDRIDIVAVYELVVTDDPRKFRHLGPTPPLAARSPSRTEREQP